jgi:hypothetical protein
MTAPTQESQEPSGAAIEGAPARASSPGVLVQEESHMAEMGPRSISNIVFIVLLGGTLVAGIMLTLRFISAAMNGPY